MILTFAARIAGPIAAGLLMAAAIAAPAMLSLASASFTSCQNAMVGLLAKRVAIASLAPPATAAPMLIINPDGW